MKENPTLTAAIKRALAEPISAKQLKQLRFISDSMWNLGNMSYRNQLEYVTTYCGITANDWESLMQEIDYATSQE